MPANTAPIFTLQPKIQWNAANILNANTAKDGTGAVDTVFTAGANGSYLQRLIIRPRGTNVATVMRVFVNDGAGTAAANNALIAEVSLPATTLSESAAIIGAELPLNFPIPPGDKINVTLGTAVAAGFTVAVIGGDY